MRALVLGSGSKGNSTLILDEKTKLLIDVGFSYPKMKTLLEKYNLTPYDIDGIVIKNRKKVVYLFCLHYTENMTKKICFQRKGGKYDKTMQKVYSCFNGVIDVIAAIWKCGSLGPGGRSRTGHNI